ncbi:MAPKKK cascade protein kinase regulator Ste50 [Pyronema omphalodes]|nr:MAPKKK cascade protein kinase regulator Ste50 [Pyronema omphalodes]
MESPSLSDGLPLRSPDRADWRDDRYGSQQPTPTTWEHRLEGDGMPDGIISEWDTEGVASWMNSLGFGKYHDALLDNDIDGEALIRLNQEELRELGVTSVGHRLSILKYVYNVKTAHDVPFDPDDYIPATCDENEQNKVATQEDVQRLIGIVKKRDARILEAESHIQALYEAMARLRNDLLPVWRMVKNKNQELPPLNGEFSSGRDDDLNMRETQESNTPPVSSSLLQPAPMSGKGLSRKFSMKKLILGTPKNASPTYPPTMHEYPEQIPTSVNGGMTISQPILPPPMDDMRGHPSPTSPAAPPLHHNPYNPHASLGPSSRGRDDRRDNRERPDRQTPRTPHYADDERGGSSGSSEPDIFKSFRVSMEDPCRKVLPAALKRYNIQADWRQYALYIVHGDQERCLGLEEKPLILFKQLDREGRKPMFMLRRNAGGADTGGGIQVPGGVL